MAKTVKIKSQSSLETLLRLIAEESVSAAKDVTGNEQNRQAKLAKDIKTAKQGFYLEEEEPAAAPAPEEPAASTPAAPPAETPAEPAPTQDIGSVEFGDIKRALNNLRAGKSVEDSAVEDKLQNFVTSLQPAERKAAYVIIKSISSILGGDEMPQEPLKSAKIMITSEEEEGAAAPPTTPGAEAPASPEAPAPDEAGASAAPPIKVGEPPVTEAFRSKIRQLIRGI
jgi:hypothetical protein